MGVTARQLVVFPQGGEAVTHYRYVAPVESMGTPYTYIDGKDFNQQKPDEKSESIAQRVFNKYGYEFRTVFTGFQGEHGAAYVETLRELGARVVVDVDDLFDEVPTGNVASIAWRGMKKRKYRQQLDSADAITASTPFLAERFGGTLAQNFVVPSEWDHPQWERPDVLIAFPAGAGRAGDILHMRDVFAPVLALPHVRMVFMGWMPEWGLEYPAGKVCWSRWAPLVEYRKLLRWIAPSIIVSPMEHNNFNIGKSNLKMLEAGMVGAAFIGERWGEYERTVRDGVDGALAVGVQEWTEKLMWLCTEQDARLRLAAAGSAMVRSKWTWDSVRAGWESVLLSGEVNEHGASNGGGLHDPGIVEHATAAG